VHKVPLDISPQVCDGTLRRWSVASRQLALTYPEFIPPGEESWCLNAVGFSPDGASAMGSDGIGPRTFARGAGTEQRQIQAHRYASDNALYLPDGTLLTSGANAAPDNCTTECATARIWDAATGRRLRDFVHPTSVTRIGGLAASADGRQFVTGGNDGVVRLWASDQEGAPLRSFGSHSGSINTVALSPDGALVLSGGADGRANLYNTGDSTLRFSFSHPTAVRSVAFASSSRIVTVAGRTAYVWNLLTGELLYAASLPVQMNSARFSPDGSLLFTAGERATARFWQNQ
jgi:WD40 repeat protein